MKAKNNSRGKPAAGRSRTLNKSNKKPKVLHWVKQQSLIARRRKPRDFDFQIDWLRVEVADQTLRELSRKMDIDEDDAFDKALDILEHHEEFRFDARWIYREYLKKKFRGEWVHLQWMTFENLQIGIENNRWNRVSYNESKLYLPDEVKQAIYAAEDGRCETCGQAMHFRVSYYLKRDWSIFRDPDNIKLQCYACAHGRQNMLLYPGLVIKDRNMDYLMERMGMDSAQDVKDYLRQSLKYAVHTNTFNPNKQQNRKQVKDMKILGQYWLPGIGRFRLQWHPGNDRRKVYTVEFVECARDPQLRIKEQSNTRSIKD
jgi:hypothetical protein